MQMSALGQLLIVSGGGQGLLAFSAFKLEVRLRVCVCVWASQTKCNSPVNDELLSMCVCRQLIRFPVTGPLTMTQNQGLFRFAYVWLGSTWSDPRSYDGSCKFLHDENPFSPPEGQSGDRWWGELQVEHKQWRRAFTAQLTACLYTIISIMCYI